MTGNFITFEGGEGSGKSTQISMLHQAMQQANVPVIKTREPGGSAGAEHIRNLLVSGDKDAWDPVTETLLFYAARLDHVNKIIKPALAEGKTILCDRFADSTLVYQGVGKKVPEKFIHSIHQLTIGDFAPGLTIILDIDPKEGLKRAHARQGNETRFESMNLEFHQAVRAGFLSIAKSEFGRCAVINANQSIPSVHAEIIALIKARLGLII